MKKPRILPVIHHLSREISLKEAKKAQDCGADGVFLISHLGDDVELLSIAAAIKLTQPGFPVGINLLSTGALNAAHWALDMEFPMLWVDSAGVSSGGLNELGRSLAALTGRGMEIFGSVAFKYQAAEAQPDVAASNAHKAGFVATTSGRGTGHAPSLDKIQQMSAATGGMLAVASGITPGNVMVYAPYLSYILVATGIALDEHRMDTGLLKELIANATL